MNPLRNSLVLLSSLLVAGVVGSGVANAQGPGAGGRPGMGGMRMKPGEREKKMLAQLNLTPDQKKKTDAIIDEQSKNWMAMRPAKGTPPTPEQREKFMAMRKATEAKIEKILTPAQVSKLKLLREQMRAKWSARPGAPGAPPKP